MGTGCNHEERVFDMPVFFGCIFIRGILLPIFFDCRFRRMKVEVFL